MVNFPFYELPIIPFVPSSSPNFFIICFVFNFSHSYDSCKSQEELETAYVRWREWIMCESCLGILMCWTKWYLLETFNKMPSECKYNVCEIYLKTYKNVKISTDHKNTFCHMYMNFIPKSHHSIFSLICLFQEPLTISTIHWVWLIPLCQTKPSTFEMIFPSHQDIALDQLVSHQCWRLVLSI